MPLWGLLINYCLQAVQDKRVLSQVYLRKWENLNLRTFHPKFQTKICNPPMSGLRYLQNFKSVKFKNCQDGFQSTLHLWIFRTTSSSFCDSMIIVSNIFQKFSSTVSQSVYNHFPNPTVQNGILFFWQLGISDSNKSL